VCAPEDAAKQYERAAKLSRELDDPDHEAEALQKLGETLTRQGRYDDALLLLERAAAWYCNHGDKEREWQTLAYIGRAHHGRGTLDPALARLQPELDSVPCKRPALALAHLHMVAGDLYAASGRRTEGLEAFRRASDIARAVGSGPDARRVLALALSHSAVTLSELGRSGEVAGALREAIAMCRVERELDGLWQSLVWLGMHERAIGELSRAEEHYRESLEVAEWTCDRFQLVGSNTSLGATYFLLGKWGEARECYERALETAEPLGDSPQAVLPHQHFARLCFAEGKWDEAKRHCEAGFRMCCERPGLMQEVFLHERIAEGELMAGNAGAARRRLEPLLARARGELKAHAEVLTLLAWAYLELARGETGAQSGGEHIARAERTGMAAIEQAEREAYRVGLVDAFRVYGMALGEQQRWGDAAASFRKAVQLAQQPSYPYGEARALHEWGLTHGGDAGGADSKSRLGSALTIFDRLGARLHAKGTRDALSSIDASGAAGREAVL
jgi:tetratricopeptide (TPR) repeat protein